MHVVVGSGPAGVACAAALLARGLEVCLVDAGLTLEPERQVTLERLRGQTSAQWLPADLAHLLEGMQVTKGGVLLKRVFGSDYPYRGPVEHLGFPAAGPALLPSLARGGLSNVWGAALLPYTAADLHGWPITAAELAPHYAAALRLTGLAGEHDGLEELFPLYAEPTPLPRSRQAQALWQRLERATAQLRARGVRYGSSRLAVQAPGAGGKPGCVQCGLCMYGCPYDFIYHAGWTLEAWREEPRFRYVPGVIVERVEETAGRVRLHGHQINGRAPWEVAADRVFLAAGVIPSTQIVLRSQEAYERPVHILDSQYFLFPLLQAGLTRGVREEPLYTLSQLFLELFDAAALGEETVHLQIYSYSDIIGQAVRQALGPLGRWDWAVRQLEGRFLIAQGYLHSRHSSRLRLELARGGALRVEPEINPATARRVRRVVRKILRQAWTLRAVALEPLLQLTPPGRGFHSGGSLPMRAQPGDLETDVTGRPHGWERVHVVDASVFPSIPATTITLSAMANAHRIGTLAG